MQMKRLTNKGFTLIELMIVIAIIGVLSVVLIPKALPLKNQAKNNGVQANVYIVRSFLENRAGEDRTSIVSSLGTNTDTTSIGNALKPIKDDIGLKIIANFSGSSAMKNPFNNKTTINSTYPNIQNNDPINSSVVIGYDTTNIPTAISSITSTIITPGVVAIIVYQTGYVVYGVDNFGTIVQPTLVNMPNRVAKLPILTNPPPPVPITVPADPKNLVVTSNKWSHQAHLEWTDIATNETGYYVYWSADGIKPASPNMILPANAETCDVINLYYYTSSYTFWVNAYNSAGISID